MPDFSQIPYTSAQCRKMRKEIIKDAFKSEDAELTKHVSEEMNKYKRQGAAYGMLTIIVPIGLTYYKYKNFKPHLPGVILGLSLGYFLGGLAALDMGEKLVFESLGRIEKHPELDNRRVDVQKKCWNVS